jgi:hypothetical protein
LALGQKENDPKQILESLERWSGYATLWILAGIVVEIGALIWFPHGFCERIVGIIANALIGVGLVAEYIVIGRAIVATREADRESEEKVAKANQRAVEATERAAEANQKAQEAELKIAELNNETARLREQGALTTDAVLETAKATKANALAAQFLLALSRQLAQ